MFITVLAKSPSTALAIGGGGREGRDGGGAHEVDRPEEIDGSSLPEGVPEDEDDGGSERDDDEVFSRETSVIIEMGR